MFRAVAVVALAAAAADAETVSLFKTQEDVVHLEATTAFKTSVSPLIADITSDLDAISSSVGVALDSAVATARSNLAAARYELLATVADLDANVTDAIALAKESNDVVSGELRNHVEEKIADTNEWVASQLNGYKQIQTWPNATNEPKYDERNYELIQVAIAGSDTENGHAGRVMYKVKFNVNNPGFWYPDRNELHHACNQLSADLKSIDGIDRDIKPACDQDWACDGNSVALKGAYLSNCGCGSRPRKRECIGMTNDFLGGAAMYNRQNSWNGCWMLRHDSVDCHHHWAHCYTTSGVQAEHTICTSNNNQFKVPPKGWCNPKDGQCY